MPQTRFNLVRENTVMACKWRLTRAKRVTALGIITLQKKIQTVSREIMMIFSTPIVRQFPLRSHNDVYYFRLTKDTLTKKIKKKKAKGHGRRRLPRAYTYLTPVHGIDYAFSIV